MSAILHRCCGAHQVKAYNKECKLPVAQRTLLSNTPVFISESFDGFLTKSELAHEAKRTIYLANASAQELHALQASIETMMANGEEDVARLTLSLLGKAGKKIARLGDFS
jgi:hypothetical protein